MWAGVVVADRDENRSTDRACSRISASAREWYGSSRWSRKMSSPCSVQQMPQPIASLSAGASEISMELEMSITSGPRLRAQPVHELVELLPLAAVPALEHRDGELPQLLGLRLHAALRDRPQQPRRLPQAIDQPGRAAEEPRVLLQVNADPAEEDPVLADARLVGARRRVERDQGAPRARDIAATSPACCRGCSFRSTCRRRRR